MIQKTWVQSQLGAIFDEFVICSSLCKDLSDNLKRVSWKTGTLDAEVIINWEELPSWEKNAQWLAMSHFVSIKNVFYIM